MSLTTITTIPELRAILDDHRAEQRTVGFVPTMGYLHPGHASLMDAARVHELVVTSIFVNPLQFGPSEDLDAYPRDLTGDTELAERSGVDLLFVPSTREMYPESIRTTVSVTGISEVLEGRTRPTHFDGVATVVAKLFAIVGPCHSYFGEKDFQQLAVVRQMVRDLSIPVEVVGCPTVREADGLAMSSRNAYLTPGEREAAPVVHAALEVARAAVAAGEVGSRGSACAHGRADRGRAPGPARLRRGRRRRHLCRTGALGGHAAPACGRPLREGPAHRQRWSGVSGA